MVNELDFLSLKKIVARLKRMCTVRRMIWLILFMVSNEKFENCKDLLLIVDNNKPYYVYIKDYKRSICNKKKWRTKKYFCKYCLQCFSSERVLIEHKATCLEINGK